MTLDNRGEGENTALMLTTCASCKHPYAALSDGACPHCGVVAMAEHPEVQSGAEEPSAVVAEGGEGAEEPPQRRRKLRKHEGPAPSLKEGAPAFERNDVPKLRGFLSTFVDVMFRPRAFFGHLSLDGARGITWFAYVCLLASMVWDAIGNYMITPLFTTLVEALEEAKAAMLTPGLEELAKTDADAAEKWEQVQKIVEAIEQIQNQIALAPTLFVVSLIAAPILAFFAIHLVSGLLHLTFRLLNIGGEPVPYEQTYRFVVYATAPLAMGILPGAAFFSKIWFLIVLVIAMRRLHRPRALGVIAGILLPVILLAQVGAGTVTTVAEAVKNLREPPPTEQATEGPGKGAKEDVKPSAAPSAPSETTADAAR